MPCSAVTLSLATISAIVAVVLLAIAFSTDNWLSYEVKRNNIQVCISKSTFFLFMLWMCACQCLHIHKCMRRDRIFFCLFFCFFFVFVFRSTFLWNATKFHKLVSPLWIMWNERSLWYRWPQCFLYRKDVMNHWLRGFD